MVEKSANMIAVIRRAFGVRAILAALFLASSCNRGGTSSDQRTHALEVMSNSWQKNLLFDEEFFGSFGKQNNVKVHFVPNARLSLYRQLLGARSSQPDLVSLDVVWPAMVAENLVDLRPFLQNRLKDFAPELLASYTVHGRIVAIPLTIDLGVLYYRADLLAKYGFHKPPETWDELENMATRIQTGQRTAGNTGFWGYMWQGALSEGGTCNALEWQASAGAGTFIEANGRVNVVASQFEKALERALRWMGTISPQAEYVYWEDDTFNLWAEGKTAFMRNWASAYGSVAEDAAKKSWHFAVAPLPAGPGGHRGSLGGMGMGVSKYAANRDLAIKALLELTNEHNDLARVMATDGIPVHVALSEREDVKSRSPLLAVSSALLAGLVARPSVIAGDKYDQASHEYASAVNAVLSRKESPHFAIEKLGVKLTRLTGFPAKHD